MMSLSSADIFKQTPMSASGQTLEVENAWGGTFPQTSAHRSGRPSLELYMYLIGEVSACRIPRAVLLGSRA